MFLQFEFFISFFQCRLWKSLIFLRHEPRWWSWSAPSWSSRTQRKQSPMSRRESSLSKEVFIFIFYFAFLFLHLWRMRAFFIHQCLHDSQPIMSLSSILNVKFHSSSSSSSFFIFFSFFLCSEVAKIDAKMKQVQDDFFKQQEALAAAQQKQQQQQQQQQAK